MTLSACHGAADAASGMSFTVSKSGIEFGLKEGILVARSSCRTKLEALESTSNSRNSITRISGDNDGRLLACQYAYGLKSSRASLAMIMVDSTTRIASFSFKWGKFQEFTRHDSNHGFRVFVRWVIGFKQFRSVSRYGIKRCNTAVRGQRTIHFQLVSKVKTRTPERWITRNKHVEVLRIPLVEKPGGLSVGQDQRSGWNTRQAGRGTYGNFSHSPVNSQHKAWSGPASESELGWPRDSRERDRRRVPGRLLGQGRSGSFSGKEITDVRGEITYDPIELTGSRSFAAKEITEVGDKISEPMDLTGTWAGGEAGVGALAGAGAFAGAGALRPKISRSERRSPSPWTSLGPGAGATGAGAGAWRGKRSERRSPSPWTSPVPEAGAGAFAGAGALRGKISLRSERASPSPWTSPVPWAGQRQELELCGERHHRRPLQRRRDHLRAHGPHQDLGQGLEHLQAREPCGEGDHRRWRDHLRAHGPHRDLGLGMWTANWDSNRKGNERRGD
ncbi:hypothetical protein BDP27DRAFT_1406830 [Rhodocollybia butyracea]|uniref:Uncharacterized protein n=1 Tax=Rhodocollybia butyracea TaxID=206335 RepID=A0A9P5PC64_9AGAR|nr:hypothetical protein BDP27DRAFT_1406830 [Rhodocollybia butyracea]